MTTPLDPVEARILGSLIEKEATTPEQYPLTENAVLVACNQKTSREPVMKLTIGEVGHALRQMEGRGLVRAVHGARTQRYEHRAAQAYSLTQQQQAVLALLLLRGPQTNAELLARSARMARFTGTDDLTHAMDRLQQRDPPLLVRLPRAPGQREERFMHLLCGPVDVDAWQASATPDEDASDPTLGERLQRLEQRVAALEAALGMDAPENSRLGD